MTILTKSYNWHRQWPKDEVNFISDVGLGHSLLGVRKVQLIALLNEDKKTHNNKKK